MSRRLTFMIIPEGGERVFSRNISSRLFKLIIVLSSIWLVFLICVTVIYARLSVQASKSAMLQDENQKLREYFTRVIDIEQSFKRNQELTARLAQMAGVDLGTMTGQPKINFDSLASQSDSGMQNLAITVESESTMTPEQLLHSHIPHGRPLYGWITKSFSAVDSAGGGKHSGIDFAVKDGTAVSATASGTVSFAGWDESLGNLIIIDHGNGYLTSYGHNRELLVEKGEKVTRGEVIALSGNTGRSTAPHLHYEIVKDGIAIDPAPYLD
jgi:murein DD-endopeptidase MepM/ murein hydrolase activator NlpD